MTTDHATLEAELTNLLVELSATCTEAEANSWNVLVTARSMRKLLAAFELQRGEIQELERIRTAQIRVIEIADRCRHEREAEISRLTQALQEARSQLEGRPNGPK